MPDDRRGPGTTASDAPPYPAAALRAAFLAADYGVDPVVQRITDTGQAALARNHTVPAERALGDDHDPLATLIRLFPLQRTVSRDHADAALPGLVDALVATEVLDRDGDEIRARVDLRPYAGDDGVAGWVASDLTPGLDGELPTARDDYVLGLSPASSTLAMITTRDRVDTALDLGTGCGVQALHLARHAGRVTGTDLNPRALTLARLTADLNGLDLELLAGDLYAPVADRRFDQIVSNPPYVMSPPDAARLAYREGDRPGDALVAEVVAGAARHLTPGGRAQLLVNWAHPAGGDWRDRLAGWFAGTGCAAHVVQREVLDPAAYVEMWLADGGMIGRPGYREAYAGWLDYLERQRVAAVGMGWIFLTRTDLHDPPVELEDHPGPVSQPVGPALGRGLDRLVAARADDDQLLDRHLVQDRGLVLESLSEPGSADPFRLTLLQSYGLAHRHEVDTALAAVVGACDGDLSLRVIIAAVASLLELDAEALTAALLPRLRELVRAGSLTEERP